MKRYAATTAYAPVNVDQAAGATGATAQPLASRLYIQSRGENLVSNGSGLLGNNYNFSPFTFDPAEVYSGAGSFLRNAASGQLNTTEYMPVDPSKIYRLAGWAKSGETGGANFNAANRQFLGVILYDADQQIVWPFTYIRISGSTDTTLAADLDPDDTTMTLTDATGWYEGATVTQRQFSWWPYTNALGYTYPTYTYTRNSSHTYSSNNSLGTWSQDGIVGNVITLRVGWAGPALAAGTPVRNNNTGSSYKYVAASNVIVPNTWTYYSGLIGTLDTTGYTTTFANPAGGSVHTFPYGTAYVRVLFLVNYHDAADNNIRWNNVWFGEIGGEYNAAAEAARAAAAEADNELVSWFGGF